MSQNIYIVERLPNDKFIVELESYVDDDKYVSKYALANKDDLVTLHDKKGNISPIQTFDIYEINDAGDIIIGVQKSGKEYYDRVLSHFDLSDTYPQIIEEAGGPFNIGPYAKPYYQVINPTKTIEDIVPKKLSYNYGIIGRDGKLLLYPTYDSIVFGNEDTCMVGMIGIVSDLDWGYYDLLSKEFLTPISFPRADKFFDGKALIKYKRRFGFIDRNKVMTNPNDNSQYATNLEPKFFRATSFKDGKALVYITQATHLTKAIKYYIDGKGEVVGFPRKVKRYIPTSENK